MGGQGLDEWVVPELEGVGSHREGPGCQGAALPGPEQLGISGRQGQGRICPGRVGGPGLSSLQGGRPDPGR